MLIFLNVSLKQQLHESLKLKSLNTCEVATLLTHVKYDVSDVMLLKVSKH